MLTLNVLIELLDEKGLIGKKEILDRVKRLPGPDPIEEETTLAGAPMPQ